MAQHGDIGSLDAAGDQFDQVQADQREREDVNPSPAAKRAARAALVDAPSLGAALGEISREIAGQSPERIAAPLAARLARTAPFRAAGIWLARPDGRSYHRHALSVPGELDEPSDVPSEVVEPALTGNRLHSHPLTWPGSALSIARELLPPSVPTALLRSLSFTAVPLRRRDRPSGLLALFSTSPLDDSELAALQLFGFHVAAELARMSMPTPAPPAPATMQPSSNSKVDFISLLTHELRSPLTGLRGNVQLASMAVRKGDYSRIEARLGAAMRQVDAVNALVTNLQDINHLERGIFVVSPTPGDLTATVRGVVQRVERGLPVDHLAFEVVAPEPIICAYDSRRIEQVLFNLLVNAVAYSPDGGRIEVGVERDPRAAMAMVTISDQGIGIPVEEQECIFEPYVRGTNGRVVNAGGLGLGLAISRETMLRHGGTIDVLSRPEQGSHFVVRLPLSEQDALV